MMQTPCSDYRETEGLMFFARMLDKIRLHNRDLLAPSYDVTVSDPTGFNARCAKFLQINYEELVARTLAGGSDEEILHWCFEHGRRPSAEEIHVWNAYITKRGWQDESTASLHEAKQQLGFGSRDDIETWVDLHDADEGRMPRYAQRKHG